MSQIGKPVRIIEVVPEPLHAPADIPPLPEPEKTPVPVEPEKEKVPA